LCGIQLATATLTGYNCIAFDTLASCEKLVLSAVKVTAVTPVRSFSFDKQRLAVASRAIKKQTDLGALWYKQLRPPLNGPLQMIYL
jgi:hypothetical protein